MEQVSKYKTEESLWFEIYTSYYKYSEAIKLLKTGSMEYFIPMRTEIISCSEGILKKHVPSIPGIIFVRTTMKKIKCLCCSNPYLCLKVTHRNNITEPFIVPNITIQKIMELYRLNGNSISFTDINRLLY